MRITLRSVAVFLVILAVLAWSWDASRPSEINRVSGIFDALGAMADLGTRMVPPNGRNQCSKIFAFRQQSDDADTLAQEYHEDFAECRYLPIGHFIASDGYNSMYGYLDISSTPLIVWGKKTA